MARRKKTKDPAADEQKRDTDADLPAQGGPDEPPREDPTQVDIIPPPMEPMDPMEEPEEIPPGAAVDHPMKGETEPLFNDEPPVPEEPTDEHEHLASVTDIASVAEPPADASSGDGEAEAPGVDPGRLEVIVESLLFASDRPLGLADLKRLLGERDGKKVTAAIETLTARRADSGVLVTSAAGGWQLRTNPAHAPWVGKLLAGKPVRLSRAMLETLSIVAYRQPVTRPELDDIRGVDCGPVLKTLLDRGLVRIIGKKEEVGRPLLYGTTPEFLRTFNLRDLSELPTLREFHELGAEEKAEVDAAHGAPAGGVEGTAPAAELAAAAESVFTPHPPLAPDPEEDDGLIQDLERAAEAAARATSVVEPRPSPPAPEPPPSEGTTS